MGTESSIRSARPAASTEEQAASDHLVRGVDFLFALALGQGILLFRDFWTQPLAHGASNGCAGPRGDLLHHRPILYGLASGDGAASLPHRVGVCVLAANLRRARFGVDLLIVATYAFLVVNAVPLIADPDADLSVFLAGFPATFFLYFIWSVMRRRRYPDAGSPLAMAVTLVAFSVLYAVYRIHEGPSSAGENNLFLLAALVLTVLYRVVNALVALGGARRSLAANGYGVSFSASSAPAESSRSNSTSSDGSSALAASSGANRRSYASARLHTLLPPQA